MVRQFTLKKSSSSNIQYTKINNPAIRQTGEQAARQSGNRASWQAVALNFFFCYYNFFYCYDNPLVSNFKCTSIGNM